MRTINYYIIEALPKAIYVFCVAFISLLMSCSKDNEAGGYFELKDNPSKIEATAEGASETFTIKASGRWQIKPLNKQNWIKIEPAEGNGDGTVTVTVNKNYTQEARANTLFFSMDGQLRNQVLKVEQGASAEGGQESEHYLKFDGGLTSLAIPEEGINKTYVLRSTGDWRIEIVEGQDWLNISPMEGRFDAGITVRTDVNASVTPRKGKLMFYLDGEAVPGEILVSQEGMVVILQEDFSWLNYGSEVFSVTTGETRMSSWTTEQLAKGWTGTIPPAGSFPPLATVSTYVSTYARVGFVKLGRTNYGGDIISPKLSAVQGTKNLQVSFKAVRYAIGDHSLLKIGIIGPGTVSVNSYNVTNVASPNSDLAACRAAWQAPEANYSFVVTGATAETQIRFFAGDYFISTDAKYPNHIWPSNTNRIFLDDVLISVKK